MQKIKGPITFKKGGSLPQKAKEWIKKNGLRLPFGISGFSYSNAKLDDFLVFRNKKDGKKYKYDRKTGKDVEVNSIQI